MNTGSSSAAPRALGLAPQAAQLADTPPAMPTARAPCQRAAAKVRSTSVSTTRALEAGGDVLQSRLAGSCSTPSAAWRART